MAVICCDVREKFISIKLEFTEYNLWTIWQGNLQHFAVLRSFHWKIWVKSNNQIFTVSFIYAAVFSIDALCFVAAVMVTLRLRFRLIFYLQRKVNKQGWVAATARAHIYNSWNNNKKDGNIKALCCAQQKKQQHRILIICICFCCPVLLSSQHNNTSEMSSAVAYKFLLRLVEFSSFLEWSAFLLNSNIDCKF